MAYDQKFTISFLKQKSNFLREKQIQDFFSITKKENGTLFGYQAEVDGSDRKWSGGLYDEGRRGWIHPKKPIENIYNKYNWKDVRKNAFKRNEWNRYKIRCVDDHIQIWVNDIKTTDLKDSTDKNGYIAIQHHGEKGQIYRFRNIQILEL